MDTMGRFKRNTLLDEATGCILWTGYIQPNGYAYITVGSRTDNSRRRMGAHRWAYELFKGPIPDGLTIDHLCRAPRCVNPDHLEAVTMAENLYRGRTITAAHKGATHCPQGHPYSGDNLYSYPNGNRGCRACRRRDKSITLANHNGEKTHCPQGHPYSGDNLGVTGGSRRCRTCARENARAKRGNSKRGRPFQSHCKRGHPLSGDNLYVSPNGKVRECRACRRVTRAANRH